MDGDVSAESGGLPEAATPGRRPARSQKPRRKPRAPPHPAPAKAEEPGEAPAAPENRPEPPEKVPRKRGRKSKAELLLLQLSQGPLCTPQLGDNEVPEGMETTPGGRPKRRAAKVALMYLQELAQELSSVYQSPVPSETVPDQEADGPKRKRRSRRREGEEMETDGDDPSQDADFVPSAEVLLQAEEEEEEEEEESEALLSQVSELEPDIPRRHSLKAASAGRSKPQCRGFAANGFHNSIMTPVWKCFSITRNLRDRNYSPWEFPDWIPLAHKWTFLSENEAAPYLPEEVKSPLFSIQREGIEEDGILYRINRFNSLQPHEERWDVSFFVGGPVWAMEWCPTPEGSAASQHVALYCHRGMDEKHSLAKVHTGPSLLQLWSLGPLQHEAGSATKAALAYAIATNHGCIWDMKFCPSGAWEPPMTSRKLPQLSRLGLLAVALSNGRVVLYTLPHPEALQALKRTQVKDEPLPKHTVCQVQCIATLQVGSIQAGSSSECGQCFSLSWMPTRPHHRLAAGFYDGTVAIWNLSTMSLLQRVYRPDGSLKLYPAQCFLAHDHAVRSMEWCKANSNFLVTAGNDRKIKFWDLRRLYEPINSIKRFLSTEVVWLLPYNGVTVAQDNCYASYGLCGIHYIDAGYLGFKAYFVAPRKGTVWSISGSDWLNTVVAGDVTGELVAAVLPDLAMNPLNIKRPSERRFPASTSISGAVVPRACSSLSASPPAQPIYKADLLPCSPVGTQDVEQPAPKAKTYGEMVAQHYIRFQDTNLRNFQNFPSREPMRRMHVQEVKSGLSLDRLQLESIHKVRFSPNQDSHGWLVSGGQAGIVRVHCLAGLALPGDCQPVPGLDPPPNSASQEPTASPSPGPAGHLLSPAE